MAGAEGLEPSARGFGVNPRSKKPRAFIRTVDSTQYKNRMDSFDYDMTVSIWGQSLSPGNEQIYFWGSQTADSNGSYNYIGIKDKVVDALIEKIIEAPDRNALKTATKALDRVLLHNHYVIPHWHTPVQRFVMWNKFGIPSSDLMQGAQIMTWWFDAEKEENLKKMNEQRRRFSNKASLFKRLKEWF